MYRLYRWLSLIIPYYSQREDFPASHVNVENGQKKIMPAACGEVRVQQPEPWCCASGANEHTEVVGPFVQYLELSEVIGSTSHHPVMDNHDLVLKLMVTWASLILRNLHLSIRVWGCYFCWIGAMTIQIIGDFEWEKPFGFGITRMIKAGLGQETCFLWGFTWPCMILYWGRWLKHGTEGTNSVTFVGMNLHGADALPYFTAGQAFPVSVVA